MNPSFAAGIEDKEDPFGYIYSLDSPVCFLPADPNINPNDAAPKLCQGNGVCGAHAEQTALYLTETSSSVESVPDGANKQVSTPKPNTPGPAPSPNTPAPQPNTPDPAPNNPAPGSNTPAPVSVTKTPTPAQQSTSPDAAANIGALLNPGSQTIPPQTSPTQPVIPQPTIETGEAINQPAASPGAPDPSSPSISPAAVIIVGSSSIVANSNSVFVIGSQTLSAGGAVIISGTSITLGSAGHIAVIGGVTQQVQTELIAQSTAVQPVQIISVGGQAITANSNSALVIAGQTLVPGSATVVAGTTISVLPSGVGVVVNGATQIFQAGAQPTTLSSVLTFNGHTYIADAQSAYMIAGHTLSLGKTIVISGTTIALASAGGIAVIDGVTQTIASSPITTILTVTGQIVTATLQSSYVVSGQTLALGHPITIGTGFSKTTLSLATDSSGNSVLIVNGKTSTLVVSGGVTIGTGSDLTTSEVSSTSTNGVGDFIASGIGFSSVEPTSTIMTAGAVSCGIEMGALLFHSLLGGIGVVLWT